MQKQFHSRFHVLTPFSREHLKDFLVCHLRPMNIHWHPIHAKEIIFSEPWIHSTTLVPRHDHNPCYDKLNQWIQSQEILDQDYYHFLGDDDHYTPQFFKRLEAETADVVFVSMARGHFGVSHGCSTLRAHPNSVHVGGIGLQQIMVKGHILRQLQFNPRSGVADGEMAIELKRRYPIKYRPDAFVLFNLFEEGRW